MADTIAPSLSQAHIERFEVFWPYYLREDAHPVNRALHLERAPQGA